MIGCILAPPPFPLEDLPPPPLLSALDSDFELELDELEELLEELSLDPPDVSPPELVSPPPVEAPAELEAAELAALLAAELAADDAAVEAAELTAELTADETALAVTDVATCVV